MRGLYGGVNHTVFPNLPCTVQVISLDGTPTLRVTQDGRAIGYFTDPAQAAAHGVDLSTVIIKE